MRLAIVFDGDLTIHQHIAIALSALDPAPFAAWQIVDDFGRADLEIRVVVTDDVRWCAAFEDAAILKPGDHAGQCAQAPMRFFQAHHLVLAHRLDDHFGRITTGSQELGMGTTIRYPEQHIGIVEEFFHEAGIRIGPGGEKFSLQSIVNCDVEHRIDRMLAEQFRNIADPHIAEAFGLWGRRSSDHEIRNSHRD